MRDGARTDGETEARRAVHEATGVRSRRVDRDLSMMLTTAREAGLTTLADDLSLSLAPG